MDPSLRSYSDIAKKAFGRKGVAVSNFLCVAHLSCPIRPWLKLHDVLNSFFMELFSLSVALVVLFGDTLHAVLGGLTANQFKVIGFLMCVPPSQCSVHSVTCCLWLTSSLAQHAQRPAYSLPPPSPALLRLSSRSSVHHVPRRIYHDRLAGQAGASRQPLRPDAHQLHAGMEQASPLLRPHDGQWLALCSVHLSRHLTLFPTSQAGFSGHAVVPSIARDMMDMELFDQVSEPSLSRAPPRFAHSALLYVDDRSGLRASSLRLASCRALSSRSRR